jgi:GAF domain-containing protein
VSPAGGETGGGPLASEAGRQALLQSIVEVTRAVFSARASSIMRHDAETRQLVFEAVAGEGSGRLVGRRIPARTGLAGWALAAEEPIAVADVGRDPRFAREVAEDTGYVPRAITVYPLLAGERSLGVLNVLDQGTGARVGLADMNVLAQIATHAASVLWLIEAARAADAQGATPLAALGERLAAAAPERRAAAEAVLAALERLLDR